MSLRWRLVAKAKALARLFSPMTVWQSLLVASVHEQADHKPLKHA